MNEIAILLMGRVLQTVQIADSDLHQGRITAYGVTDDGNKEIYRFTKGQDGTYRLKGQKDGILVWSKIS